MRTFGHFSLDSFLNTSCITHCLHLHYCPKHHRKKNFHGHSPSPNMLYLGYLNRHLHGPFPILLIQYFMHSTLTTPGLLFPLSPHLPLSSFPTPSSRPPMPPTPPWHVRFLPSRTRLARRPLPPSLPSRAAPLLYPATTCVWASRAGAGGGLHVSLASPTWAWATLCTQQHHFSL